MLELQSLSNDSGISRAVHGLAPEVCLCTGKVFEVNAWNYCIDNLKDVSPGIDIEGLGATHSFSIPVPDKEPMVRTR